MIIGKHLIAGNWIAHQEDGVFSNHLINGDSLEFPNGSQHLVNLAVDAATQAFQTFGQTNSSQRAQLLRAISTELDNRAKEIIAICQQESGLPEARLTGEMGRTRGQLEMFASHIEKGNYLDKQHDPALPQRDPLPRPDLKRIMRPFGPVAVFGASNFPLAFSTAGGDTASALAAGCPVIVKSHPAHPATSDLVAQAILAAIESCNLDAGVFSLIQDSGYQVAQQLVTHPDVTAVGFTGSIKGGRALYDLCVQRSNPIPFYGEMGSINPVFVLPHALEQSAESIGTGWAGSLTLGVGQFCTKPGLIIIPEGAAGDNLVSKALDELKQATAGTMLTNSIAEAFYQGAELMEHSNRTENLLTQASSNREAAPQVYSCSGETWLENPELHEEVFGPLGIIVRTNSFEQILAIAQQLDGQLTATMHIEKSDYEEAKVLVQILENKAGRILVNGFPTGVEVADAMVHGGPYPASTYMATTSVGSHAIQRFLKPVSYQNMPDELLPGELAGS